MTEYTHHLNLDAEGILAFAKDLVLLVQASQIKADTALGCQFNLENGDTVVMDITVKSKTTSGPPEEPEFELPGEQPTVKSNPNKKLH